MQKGGRKGGNKGGGNRLKKWNKDGGGGGGGGDRRNDNPNHVNDGVCMMGNKWMFFCKHKPCGTLCWNRERSKVRRSNIEY